MKTDNETLEKTYSRTEEILLNMCPWMETEKEIWWDYSEITSPTISTFALLSSILTYDEDENKAYEDFKDKLEETGELEYYESSQFQQYLEYLDSNETTLSRNFEWHGFRDNTYNHENLLSDIFQYTIFAKNDEYYVFLEIHRGGDVRGNYSGGCIFHIYDGDDGVCSLVSSNRYTIYCNNCEAYWDMCQGYTESKADLAKVPIKDVEYLLPNDLFGEPIKTHNIVKVLDIDDYEINDEYDPDEVTEVNDTGEETTPVINFYNSGKEYKATCPCCGENLNLAVYFGN